MASLALTVFALSIALFQMTSCTKSNAQTKTDTVYQCPQGLTQTQLLTAHTWKASEIRIQLANNTTEYYLRGGTANSVNYDTDSLKFNSNNSGTYFYMGSQFTTTWNFTDAQQTKMTLVINSPTIQTFYLENIFLSDTYFCYSQYIINGLTYLATGRRTPN